MLRLSVSPAVVDRYGVSSLDTVSFFRLALIWLVGDADPVLDADVRLTSVAGEWDGLVVLVLVWLL